MDEGKRYEGFVCGLSHINGVKHYIVRVKEGAHAYSGKAILAAPLGPKVKLNKYDGVTFYISRNRENLMAWDVRFDNTAVQNQ